MDINNINNSTTNTTYSNYCLYRLPCGYCEKLGKDCPKWNTNYIQYNNHDNYEIQYASNTEV